MRRGSQLELKNLIFLIYVVTEQVMVLEEATVKNVSDAKGATCTATSTPIRHQVIL